MNVLPSRFLPAGTWLVLYPGTVCCAADLYAAAEEALRRPEGLSLASAPPWLPEALWAAGKGHGDPVTEEEVPRLRRAGVPLFPLPGGGARVVSVLGVGARWTGPREADLEPGGGYRLRQPVPGERWPYGPPDEHGPGCALRAGGVYCDCCQSAAECDCHPRKG